MHGVEDYRELNRANWDERAPAHAMSPDYNVQGYIDDPALIGHGGQAVAADHGRRSILGIEPRALPPLISVGRKFKGVSQ